MCVDGDRLDLYEGKEKKKWKKKLAILSVEMTHKEILCERLKYQRSNVLKCLEAYSDNPNRI